MKILLTVIVFLVSVGVASAATLTWDRSPESDMHHYNIYKCATTGCIVQKIPTMKQPTEVLQPAVGIKPTTAAVTVGSGQVAVTAVDITGNESGLSNQAGFPVASDTTAPGNPTGLTVK